MEKIKITVSTDRNYIISKEYQDRYGFEPGKKIVFESDGEKKVVGKII